MSTDALSDVLSHAAAKLALYRRHTRQEASRASRAEKGRRHCRAKRLRRTALVEAGGMAVTAHPLIPIGSPMPQSKAHQVWIDQCEAAQTIRARLGLKAAFEYLVGEKLLNFAEAAANTSRESYHGLSPR